MDKIIPLAIVAVVIIWGLGGWSDPHFLNALQSIAQALSRIFG